MNDDKFLTGLKKGKAHMSSGKDDRFWGGRGAGILLLAKDTGRLLLVLRSQEVNEPGTWGMPGGKIDDESESPVSAAKREAHEEVGFSGKLKLIPAHVFKSGTFSFHNFIGIVDKEFKPRLDWENDDAQWFTLDELPGNLHFGIKSLLTNSGDEIKKIIDDSNSKSLKEIKKIIGHIVEKILTEELAVDEPKGGPLGKVAFAPDRSDDVEQEDNTEIENKIQRAIELHYAENESEDLESVASKIIAMSKSNKYEKMFKPTPGVVYRLLNNVSLELGSKILGISVKEIESMPNKARFSNTNKKVNSPVQKLQSWTTGSPIETLGGIAIPSNIHEDNLYILMRSNVPESGKFFMNQNADKLLSSIGGFGEEEVISFGPVTLNGASFLYHKRPKIRITTHNLLFSLIMALQSSKKDIIPGGNK